MADSDRSHSLSKGKFAAVTLLIWFLCLLVAAPQWMMICLYAKNHLVYTLSLFCAGFLLLACIHLIEPLKYSRPFNCICVIVCYELLVLGVSTYLTFWELLNTIIIMAVSLLFAAAAIFISLLLILTAYPNPSKVAVVGCMGFAMTFCIGSIDIFENWFFLRDFEVGLFLFSIVIVMVAHVLITNDNFELLRLDDTMLVAFVLFVYYMLFLVGCRIAAHCIDANIDYYYPDEGKATTEIFKSVISIL